MGSMMPADPMSSVKDGADDTNRPKAKSLHMWQAHSLDEEFSLAKGWDKAKIDSLLNDLSNECLSPYGMRQPVEDALVGAVCNRRTGRLRESAG